MPPEYEPTLGVLSERLRTQGERIRDLDSSKASRQELDVIRGDFVELKEAFKDLRKALAANGDKVDRNTRVLLGFSFTIAGSTFAAIVALVIAFGGFG